MVRSAEGYSFALEYRLGGQLSGIYFIFSLQRVISKMPGES